MTEPKDNPPTLPDHKHSLNSGSFAPLYTADQYRAGEPIKMPEIFPANTGYKETTMCCRADEVRETIAAYRAALQACVEALEKAKPYVCWADEAREPEDYPEAVEVLLRLHREVCAAITQAQGATK